MNESQLLEKLRDAQYEETNFSKIMHAKTVQELLDIPVSSDEMLSYFVVAEEYGRIGEESIHYGRTVVERLKTACPVKTRRAFFI